jgi:hypothetical protein
MSALSSRNVLSTDRWTVRELLQPLPRQIALLERCQAAPGLPYEAMSPLFQIEAVFRMSIRRLPPNNSFKPKPLRGSA